MPILPKRLSGHSNKAEELSVLTLSVDTKTLTLAAGLSWTHCETRALNIHI